MDTQTLPFLVMTGSSEGSEPEVMVSRARQAITLDLVERALEVPALRPIVVSTNCPVLADDLAPLPVQVELDPPDDGLHFGRRLAGMIHANRWDRCFYIGGGAGPLLTASTLATIAGSMLASDRKVVTNNFYSSGWVAFGPSSVLGEHPLPETANGLGWLLGEDAGLPVRELPRSAASAELAGCTLLTRSTRDFEPLAEVLDVEFYSNE